MVVTFLVVPDFRQSATYLSRLHLGKQRVEAMQIRHLLIDLEFLSQEFNLTIPPRGSDRETIYAWIDHVNNAYKSLPCRYVRDETEGLIWTSSIRHLPEKIKENEVYTLSDDQSYVTISSKRGLNQRTLPIEEVLFPHQRIVYPIRKHPVLVLWHTYHDALADYINCHIQEWIKRGYHNTMLMYEILDDDGNVIKSRSRLAQIIDYPPWSFDQEFHRRMRARLREKEYTWFQEYEEGKRKQKQEVHYTHHPLFLDAGADDGYLW